MSVWIAMYSYYDDTWIISVSSSLENAIKRVEGEARKEHYLERVFDHAYIECYEMNSAKPTKRYYYTKKTKTWESEKI